MKKIILYTIFLVLTIISISAQIIDKPVATVNLTEPEMISMKQINQRVSQIEILKARSGLPAASFTADDRKQVLDMMIAEILLKQGAKRSGITVSENELNIVIQNQKKIIENQNGIKLTDQQFMNAITTQTKIQWNDFVKELEKQLIQQKYIESKKKDSLKSLVKNPENRQIEDFYSANAIQFTNPEIIRYSQIFVSILNLTPDEKNKAYDRAQDINKKLLNGDSTFEKLVEEYSDDPKSRYKKGDCGYISRNDQRAAAYYGDNFFRSLFSIKTGDISGVVKSNIGYHIIKITEHRDPKILKLNDPISPATSTTVRDYITSGLLKQAQESALQKVLEELISELKEEAEITIFKENIN